jgi:hypothetical protein
MSMMYVPIAVTEEEYKEVYATFGLAVYLAQCFERQLAITLSTVCGSDPHMVLRSQYDDLLSKNFKKTTGQLLHKIKEGITVPDELTTDVEEALKKRNFLMHNYFWERAVQFTTSEGRQKMIHELQDACALFQKVDSYFETITKEWGKKYGVTEARYVDELERLLKHEP